MTDKEIEDLRQQLLKPTNECQISSSKPAKSEEFITYLKTFTENHKCKISARAKRKIMNRYYETHEGAAAQSVNAEQSGRGKQTHSSAVCTDTKAAPSDVCECGHEEKEHIGENESVMTACEACHCGEFKPKAAPSITVDISMFKTKEGVQSLIDTGILQRGFLPPAPLVFTDETVEILARYDWQLNKRLVSKIESECEKCKKRPTMIPDWEGTCEDAKEGSREKARSLFQSLPLKSEEEVRADERKSCMVCFDGMPLACLEPSELQFCMKHYKERIAEAEQRGFHRGQESVMETYAKCQKVQRRIGRNELIKALSSNAFIKRIADKLPPIFNVRMVMEKIVSESASENEAFSKKASAKTTKEKKED